MDIQINETTKQIRHWTIKIDRSLCIGAATCVALAPKAYALDNEAKAVLLPTAGDESDDMLFAAAKGCPVSAISIMDDQGKQIFP